MDKLKSRANRWRAEGPALQDATVAGPIPPGGIRARPDTASSDPRADSILSSALLALRLTRERLDGARAKRRRLATMSAMVALAGLAGLAMLILVHPIGPVRSALIALAALPALAPIVTGLRLATIETTDEERLGALTESTRMIAMHAQAIRGAADEAGDEARLSPAGRKILASLLDHCEHQANAARSREWQLRGAMFENARRHARIKPRNDRTLVTTADGRKLHATIVDVSLSGIALEGNLPGIAMGAAVTIGSHGAVAVRALPRGIAFTFERPLPEGSIDAEFIV